MINPQARSIVVLGASDKEDRYAFKAIARLKAKGFPIIPIHPSLPMVLGIPVRPALKDLEIKPDTLTIYLSPKRTTPLIDDIITLQPGRVILNPGTENPELERRLDQADIPWLHACTLVLLATDRF